MWRGWNRRDTQVISLHLRPSATAIGSPAVEPTRTMKIGVRIAFGVEPQRREAVDNGHFPTPPDLIHQGCG
jgi:hypothetical protein